MDNVNYIRIYLEFQLFKRFQNITQSIAAKGLTHFSCLPHLICNITILSAVAWYDFMSITVAC